MTTENWRSLLLRITISVVVSILLIFAGVSLFGKILQMKEEPEKNLTNRYIITVESHQTQEQDYQEHVNGYGIAQAMQKTRVDSEISGVIKWISPKLEAGKIVQEKEVLVRLDDTDILAELKIAEMELSQAKTILEETNANILLLTEQMNIAKKEVASARKEWRRLHDLSINKRVSVSEADNQEMKVFAGEQQYTRYQREKKLEEIKVQRLKSQITKTEAQLSKAEHNLARTAIHAPYNGVVTYRHSQLGALVTPGAALFEIVNPEKVEVVVNLGASQYHNIHLDSEVRLQFRNYGETVWEGTVTRKSPSIRTSDRTFQIFLEIDNSKQKQAIPPGAFLNAEVAGRNYPNVFVIPRKAILDSAVLIANESSDGLFKVERVFPKVEEQLLEVVLVKGLKNGQQVITSGVGNIASGSLVRLQKEESD